MKLNIITELKESDLKNIKIHQTESQLRIALGTGRKIIPGEPTDKVPQLYYLKMTSDPGLDDWTIHALSTDMIYFLGKKSLSLNDINIDSDLDPDNSSGGKDYNTLPRILQSKISRDPLNVGGDDLRIYGEGNIIEFSGKIKWYRDNPSTKKVDPGNYVGVEITPDIGMIEKFPDVEISLDGRKFGKEIFTVHDDFDLPMALYFYPKILSLNEAHIVDIRWDMNFRERFIISISKDSHLQMRGEVIKETYGYTPTGESKLENKTLICNGNPTTIMTDLDDNYTILTEGENSRKVAKFTFDSIIQGSSSDTKMNHTWLRGSGITAFELITGSKNIEGDNSTKYVSTSLVSSKVDNLIIGNVGGGYKLNSYCLLRDCEINKLKISKSSNPDHKDSFDELLINSMNSKFEETGVVESDINEIKSLYINYYGNTFISSDSLIDIGSGSIESGRILFSGCKFSKDCRSLDLFKSGTLKNGELKIVFYNCVFPKDFQFNLGYSKLTRTHGLNSGDLMVEFIDCVNTPCTYIHEGISGVNLTVIGSKVHFSKYDSVNSTVDEFTINNGIIWNLYNGYSVDRGTYLNKFGKIRKS